MKIQKSYKFNESTIEMLNRISGVNETEKVEKSIEFYAEANGLLETDELGIIKKPFLIKVFNCNYANKLEGKTDFVEFNTIDLGLKLIKELRLNPYKLNQEQVESKNFWVYYLELEYSDIKGIESLFLEKRKVEIVINFKIRNENKEFYSIEFDEVTKQYIYKVNEEKLLEKIKQLYKENKVIIK